MKNYISHIYKTYPDVIDILLKDNTTGKNIFWATDDYKDLGKGYQYNECLKINTIIKNNEDIIIPRSFKNKKIQKQRSQNKAEVFTPTWVVNIQTNIFDKKYFGKENVFNIEDKENKTWIPILDKIEFPENKTWIEYIEKYCLEITCGEGAYLTTRYDKITGDYIPINIRVGILDKKIRILNENIDKQEEWIKYIKNIYKSVYGYDWQGDNVLLTRINLIYTFIDNFKYKFNKEPDIKDVIELSKIISWNIWQMDGLKCVIPNSCKDIIDETTCIIDGTKTIETICCKGCKSQNILEHNGIYCKIMDWGDNTPFKFVSLYKKTKDKKINKEGNSLF